MRLGDLVSGLAFVLLGIAVLGYARTLPPVPGHFYGPGLFPSIIGWGFAVGGAILAVSALRAGPGALPRFFSAPDWRAGSGRLLQVVLMFAAIAAFVLFGEFAGFAAIAFVALVAMYASAGRGLLQSFAIALGVTVGLQILFGKLLGVPLPPGEIWSLLR